MTEQAQFCYRHPDVETGLRCNRCGKPICPKCARRTATGYRCPDCIKEQQKVFVTAQWYDYLTGFGTATFLSWVASLLFGLVSGFGGFYLLFFIVAIGAGAGSLIAEAVRFVIRKRRGRSLFITAAAGVVLGGVLANIGSLIYMLLTGDISSLLSLLWPAAFIFLAATTTFMRLSGIQINR